MSVNMQMSDEGGAPGKVRFGSFTLDFARGALLGPEGEIRLRPKSFQVLCYLVRHAGTLVSRDTLLTRVWGRTVVTEDSLTQCLVEIRRALGSDGRNFVRTVPRRGYLFEADTVPVDDGIDGPSAKAPRRRRFARAGAVLAALAICAALASSVLAPRIRGIGDVPMRPIADGIAVLPFVDMSVEQDQAYFGEGIAEEILNLLAQNTQLRVIARTSSFAFSGRSSSIGEIAAKLGVTHVLQGSVRTSGNRIRVSAQLVDAATSTNVWSQVYDRNLGDVLSVQADIAGGVAELLQATMSTRPARVPATPRSARAYDHLLRGRHLFRRSTPADLQRARRQFEEALALDPEYAPAWVGLASTLWRLAAERHLPGETAVPEFIAAVDRALELDPNLPEAHLRAVTARRLSGDAEGARRHAEIAKALDPQNPLLLAWRAIPDLRAGRLDSAIPLLRQSVAGDPMAVNYRHNLAAALLAAGELSEARVEIDAAFDLAAAPDERLAALRARLLILEGRCEESLAYLEPWAANETVAGELAIARDALGEKEALAALLTSLRESPSVAAAEALAAFHGSRGDRDEAFSWLAESRRRHLAEYAFGGFAYWQQVVWTQPYFRALHGDPRWQALVASAD